MSPDVLTALLPAGIFEEHWRHTVPMGTKYQPMTKPPHAVLIIDDDPQIQRMLKSTLTAEGYTVRCASCGEEGVRCAVATPPQLILLDLVLPDMNGLEVCRTLREWFHGVIIMLSVMNKEADIITALERGADDYVTKPFPLGILLARIQAHLRRSAENTVASPPPVLHIGPLVIDQAHRRVDLAGCIIKLTPTEYAILRVLARHPGCIVTNQMLQQHAWEADDYCDPRTLRVHICHLRRKLQPTPEHPPLIITEPSVGYRLQVP